MPQVGQGPEVGLTGQLICFIMAWLGQRESLIHLCHVTKKQVHVKDTLKVRAAVETEMEDRRRL